MKSKLKLRDWHKILADVRHELEKETILLTAGSESAIAGLIDVVGPGADQVFIKINKPLSKYEMKTVDMLAIVITGNTAIDEELISIAAESSKSGLDVIAFIDVSGLSEATQKAKQVEAEIALNLSPSRVIFFSSEEDELSRQRLLSKIAERVESKRISLAAKVTGFRQIVTRQIIDEISGQNGIIGVASFIPASDLPVLTANQIRMVLLIAASHGASLTLERAKELLFVVGGGFSLRAAARQLLGFIPIAGWAVKGAIAYSGTRAIGVLAVKYFENIDGKNDTALIEPEEPELTQSLDS